MQDFDVKKDQYELSLWQDVLVKNEEVIQDGNKVTIEPYYKEEKVAIIGKNDNNSDILAFNLKFVQNVKGTNQLTFTLNAKYYDEYTGEMVDNPFIDYLKNETTVKLKIERPGMEKEIYDLIIKKSVEDSKNSQFTYTAEDKFINELGKNGFRVELDVELENNQGTVTELAGTVLKNTDWEVDKENSDVFVETYLDTMYEGVLNKNIFVRPAGRIREGHYYVPDDTLEEEEIIGSEKHSAANGNYLQKDDQGRLYLPAGTPVFLFYSDLIEKSPNPMIIVNMDQIIVDNQLPCNGLKKNDNEDYYINVYNLLYTDDNNINEPQDSDKIEKEEVTLEYDEEYDLPTPYFISQSTFKFNLLNIQEDEQLIPTDKDYVLSGYYSGDDVISFYDKLSLFSKQEEKQLICSIKDKEYVLEKRSKDITIWENNEILTWEDDAELIREKENNKYIYYIKDFNSGNQPYSYYEIKIESEGVSFETRLGNIKNSATLFKVLDVPTDINNYFNDNVDSIQITVCRAIYEYRDEDNGHYLGLYKSNHSRTNRPMTSIKLVANTGWTEMIDYLENGEPEIKFIFKNNSELTLHTNARGQKVVRSQKSGYDPDIDEYYLEYERNATELVEGREVDRVKTYRGYEKTRYVSPELAQNYLANSVNINGTDGWVSEGAPGNNPSLEATSCLSSPTEEGISTISGENGMLIMKLTDRDTYIPDTEGKWFETCLSQDSEEESFLLKFYPHYNYNGTVNNVSQSWEGDIYRNNDGTIVIYKYEDVSQNTYVVLQTTISELRQSMNNQGLILSIDGTEYYYMTTQFPNENTLYIIKDFNKDIKDEDIQTYYCSSDVQSAYNFFESKPRNLRMLIKLYKKYNYDLNYDNDDHRYKSPDNSIQIYQNDTTELINGESVSVTHTYIKTSIKEMSEKLAYQTWVKINSGSEDLYFSINGSPTTEGNFHIYEIDFSKSVYAYSDTPKSLFDESRIKIGNITISFSDFNQKIEWVYDDEKGAELLKLKKVTLYSKNPFKLPIRLAGKETSNSYYRYDRNISTENCIGYEEGLNGFLESKSIRINDESWQGIDILVFEDEFIGVGQNILKPNFTFMIEPSHIGNLFQTINDVSNEKTFFPVNNDSGRYDRLDEGDSGKGTNYGLYYKYRTVNKIIPLNYNYYYTKEYKGPFIEYQGKNGKFDIFKNNKGFRASSAKLQAYCSGGLLQKEDDKYFLSNSLNLKINEDYKPIPTANLVLQYNYDGNVIELNYSIPQDYTYSRQIVSGNEAETKEIPLHGQKIQEKELRYAFGRDTRLIRWVSRPDRELTNDKFQEVLDNLLRLYLITRYPLPADDPGYDPDGTGKNAYKMSEIALTNDSNLDGLLMEINKQFHLERDSGNDPCLLTEILQDVNSQAYQEYQELISVNNPIAFKQDIVDLIQQILDLIDYGQKRKYEWFTGVDVFGAKKGNIQAALKKAINTYDQLLDNLDDIENDANTGDNVTYVKLKRKSNIRKWLENIGRIFGFNISSKVRNDSIDNNIEDNISNYSLDGQFSDEFDEIYTQQNNLYRDWKQNNSDNSLASNLEDYYEFGTSNQKEDYFCYTQGYVNLEEELKKEVDVFLKPIITKLSDGLNADNFVEDYSKLTGLGIKSLYETSVTSQNLPQGTDSRGRNYTPLSGYYEPKIDSTQPGYSTETIDGTEYGVTIQDFDDILRKAAYDLDINKETMVRWENKDKLDLYQKATGFIDYLFYNFFRRDPATPETKYYIAYPKIGINFRASIPQFYEASELKFGQDVFIEDIRTINKGETNYSFTADILKKDALRDYHTRDVIISGRAPHGVFHYTIEEYYQYLFTVLNDLYYQVDRFEDPRPGLIFDNLFFDMPTLNHRRDRRMVEAIKLFYTLSELNKNASAHELVNMAHASLKNAKVIWHLEQDERHKIFEGVHLLIGYLRLSEWASTKELLEQEFFNMRRRALQKRRVINEGINGHRTDIETFTSGEKYNLAISLGKHLEGEEPSTEVIYGDYSTDYFDMILDEEAGIGAYTIESETYELVKGIDNITYYKVKISYKDSQNQNQDSVVSKYLTYTELKKCFNNIQEDNAKAQAYNKQIADIPNEVEDVEFVIEVEDKNGDSIIVDDEFDLSQCQRYHQTDNNIYEKYNSSDYTTQPDGIMVRTSEYTPNVNGDYFRCYCKRGESDNEFIEQYFKIDDFNIDAFQSNYIECENQDQGDGPNIYYKYRKLGWFKWIYAYTDKYGIDGVQYEMANGKWSFWANDKYLFVDDPKKLKKYYKGDLYIEIERNRVNTGSIVSEGKGACVFDENGNCFAPSSWFNNNLTNIVKYSRNYGEYKLEIGGTTPQFTRFVEGDYLTELYVFLEDKKGNYVHVIAETNDPVTPKWYQQWVRKNNITKDFREFDEETDGDNIYQTNNFFKQYNKELDYDQHFAKWKDGHFGPWRKKYTRYNPQKVHVFEGYELSPDYIYYRRMLCDDGSDYYVPYYFQDYEFYDLAKKGRIFTFATSPTFAEINEEDSSVKNSAMSIVKATLDYEENGGYFCEDDNGTYLYCRYRKLYSSATSEFEPTGLWKYGYYRKDKAERMLLHKTSAVPHEEFAIMCRDGDNRIYFLGYVPNADAYAEPITYKKYDNNMLDIGDNQQRLEMGKLYYKAKVQIDQNNATIYPLLETSFNSEKNKLKKLQNKDLEVEVESIKKDQYGFQNYDLIEDLTFERRITSENEPDDKSYYKNEGNHYYYYDTYTDFQNWLQGKYQKPNLGYTYKDLNNAYQSWSDDLKETDFINHENTRVIIADDAQGNGQKEIKYNKLKENKDKYVQYGPLYGALYLDFNKDKNRYDKIFMSYEEIQDKNDKVGEDNGWYIEVSPAERELLWAQGYSDYLIKKMIRYHWSNSDYDHYCEPGLIHSVRDKEGNLARILYILAEDGSRVTYHKYKKMDATEKENYCHYFVKPINGALQIKNILPQVLNPIYKWTMYDNINPLYYGRIKTLKILPKMYYGYQYPGAKFAVTCTQRNFRSFENENDSNRILYAMIPQDPKENIAEYSCWVKREVPGVSDQGYFVISTADDGNLYYWWKVKETLDNSYKVMFWLKQDPWNWNSDIPSVVGYQPYRINGTMLEIAKRCYNSLFLITQFNPEYKDKTITYLSNKTGDKTNYDAMELTNTYITYSNYGAVLNDNANTGTYKRINQDGYIIDENGNITNQKYTGQIYYKYKKLNGDIKFTTSYSLTGKLYEGYSYWDYYDTYDKPLNGEDDINRTKKISFLDTNNQAIERNKIWIPFKGWKELKGYYLTAKTSSDRLLKYGFVSDASGDEPTTTDKTKDLYETYDEFYNALSSIYSVDVSGDTCIAVLNLLSYVIHPYVHEINNYQEMYVPYDPVRHKSKQRYYRRSSVETPEENRDVCYYDGIYKLWRGRESQSLELTEDILKKYLRAAVCEYDYKATTFTIDPDLDNTVIDFDFSSNDTFTFDLLTQEEEYDPVTGEVETPAIYEKFFVTRATVKNNYPLQEDVYQKIGTVFYTDSQEEVVIPFLDGYLFKDYHYTSKNGQIINEANDFKTWDVGNSINGDVTIFKLKNALRAYYGYDTWNKQKIFLRQINTNLLDDKYVVQSFFTNTVNASDVSNGKLKKVGDGVETKMQVLPTVAPDSTDLYITEYYIYDKEDPRSESKATINYLYAGMFPTTEGGFKKKYDESCPKIRSVKQKEQNYLNILQSINETFQCWAKYQYEHEENSEVCKYIVKPIWVNEKDDNDVLFEEPKPYIYEHYLKIIRESDENITNSGYEIYIKMNHKWRDTPVGMRPKEGDVLVLSGSKEIDKNGNITEIENEIEYTCYYDKVNREFYFSRKDGGEEKTLLNVTEWADCYKYDLQNDIFYNASYKNKWIKVPQKTVTFKRYIGKVQNAGFKYGVNLDQIQRNIDSAQLYSKLIVKNANNDVAKDGYCSIQRASINPIKENFILNFDYYIQKGMLNYQTVLEDLYWPEKDENHNDIGYYVRLADINKDLDLIANRMADMNITLDKVNAKYDTYSLLQQSAMEEISKLTLVLTDKYNIKLEGEWVFNRAKLKKIIRSIWSEPQDVIYKEKDDYGNLQTMYEYINIGEYNAIEIGEYNDQINKFLYEMDIFQSKYKKYTNLMEKYKGYKDEYEAQIAFLIARQKEMAAQKERLNVLFYKKYANYIKEGSWTSEKYLDDNVYYLDALGVGRTSAFPKITYTLKVLDLSNLYGYEYLDFHIGDKTFIEDTEYFGYNHISNTPYQEEVIISEVTRFLDEPSKNTYKVQNYKTQFEDLFQRIAAATQQLQLNNGAYKVAAAAFNGDGTINAGVLQKSLAGNSLDFIFNQVLEISKTKITVNDIGNNFKLRLANGALSYSENGEDFKPVMNHSGLVADLLTGSLDIDKVSIHSSTNPNMNWDAAGITAYRTDGNNIDYSAFARFDQYGFYGITDYKRSDSDQGASASYIPASISDLFEKASFGLTWDGFFMKSGNKNERIFIGTEQDFRMQTYLNGKWADRLTIGQLKDDNGETYYGMEITDSVGAPIFKTSKNGDLTLSGTIYAKAGSIGDVQIIDGGLYHIDSDTQSLMFSLDKYGKLVARNAEISGVLKTTVLEKDSIQSVGGTVLVRPSYKIERIEEVTDNEENRKLYVIIKQNLGENNLFVQLIPSKQELSNNDYTIYQIKKEYYDENKNEYYYLINETDLTFDINSYNEGILLDWGKIEIDRNTDDFTYIKNIALFNNDQSQDRLEIKSVGLYLKIIENNKEKYYEGHYSKNKIVLYASRENFNNLELQQFSFCDFKESWNGYLGKNTNENKYYVIADYEHDFINGMTHNDITGIDEKEFIIISNYNYIGQKLKLTYVDRIYFDQSDDYYYLYEIIDDESDSFLEYKDLSIEINDFKDWIENSGYCGDWESNCTIIDSYTTTKTDYNYYLKNNGLVINSRKDDNMLPSESFSIIEGINKNNQLYTLPALILGHLDGLYYSSGQLEPLNSLDPSDFKMSGYGLWGNNVYLRGSIYVDEGIIGGIKISKYPIYYGYTDKNNSWKNGLEIPENIQHTIPKQHIRYAQTLESNYNKNQTGFQLDNLGKIRANDLIFNYGEIGGLIVNKELGIQSNNYSDLEGFKITKNGKIYLGEIDLKEKITALEGDCTTLEGNYTALEEGYTALNNYITNSINVSINNLEGSYTTLQGNYTTLQENYTTLQQQYATLNNNLVNSIQTAINNLSYRTYNSYEDTKFKGVYGYTRTSNKFEGFFVGYTKSDLGINKEYEIPIYNSGKSDNSEQWTVNQTLSTSAALITNKGNSYAMRKNKFHLVIKTADVLASVQEDNWIMITFYTT